LVSMIMKAPAFLMLAPSMTAGNDRARFRSRPVRHSILRHIGPLATPIVVTTDCRITRMLYRSPARVIAAGVPGRQRMRVDLDDATAFTR